MWFTYFEASPRKIVGTAPEHLVLYLCGVTGHTPFGGFTSLADAAPVQVQIRPVWQTFRMAHPLFIVTYVFMYMYVVRYI